jgi:hypothetical protein
MRPMTSARIAAALAIALLVSSGADAAGARTKTKRPAKAPVLAVDAKALARAKEALTGCDQSPVSDGALFQCKQLVAMINEKLATPAELVDADLEMIRSLGGELTMSEVKIDVGGKSLPGVGIEMKSQARGREHIVGRILAFETKKGSARSILCFSSKPTETDEYTCKKLFDALGIVGPGPFLTGALKLPDPAFLGRKIGVPDGCKVLNSDANSFRVECPDGAALFYSRAKTIRAAEIVANEFYTTFLKTGTAAPERPCVLGGVPISCRVVDSEEATFYLGIATVGAEPVIAICYQHPALIGAHPVCKDVFSF